MMDQKEKIIQLVKQKGPVLPIDVSKELKLSTLLSSAFLSDLVSKKELNISHLKVGGSPLYYLTGQEVRLQGYSRCLHEKEQKAYSLLREKKILRDTVQEPVMRIALRNINDFAKPINVKFDSAEELFWKWYLLPTSDAEEMIKEDLGIRKKRDIPEEIKSEIKKPEPAEGKARAVGDADGQKTLWSKTDIEAIGRNDFIEKVKDFFSSHRIELVTAKVIKKGSEYEFFIKLPSEVGMLNYYCRAKNKKRISDSDLSLVYVQSEMNKLPSLFLISGELTKKAKEIKERAFKNIIVHQI